MNDREPKMHNIKVAADLHPALVDGRKTAEFRKNDRDYCVGDTLSIWPLEADGTTGRHASTHGVTHVVYGPAYGIPDGYCMMSLGTLSQARRALAA